MLLELTQLPSLRPGTSLLSSVKMMSAHYWRKVLMTWDAWV